MDDKMKRCLDRLLERAIKEDDYEAVYFLGKLLKDEEKEKVENGKFIKAKIYCENAAEVMTVETVVLKPAGYVNIGINPLAKMLDKGSYIITNENGTYMVTSNVSKYINTPIKGVTAGEVIEKRAL